MFVGVPAAQNKQQLGSVESGSRQLFLVLPRRHHLTFNKVEVHTWEDLNRCY